MNAGTATINWLYENQLRVDAKWSERDAHGFTWWADRNVQRIEIVRTDHDSGLGDSFLIRVRTEYLDCVSLDEKTLNVIGAILMPFASMAGPVYDPSTRRLSLSSMVRVHEGIREWMAPLISMASVLQVGEVRIVGPQLAELLEGTRFATSGHPQNGLRSRPDEMADIIASLIAPAGKRPPHWTEREFSSAVKNCMMRPPSLGASAGGTGLTVEFPYGDFSSLCQMKSDEKHPRYGHGLHVRQSFPVKVGGDVEGLRLALELNAQELERDPAGYGFGSYCYRDRAIHFCSFWPNAVYREGQLENIYWGCAARARRLSERFCGDDWSELSPSATPAQAQGFFQRLARNFSRRRGG